MLGHHQSKRSGLVDDGLFWWMQAAKASPHVGQRDLPARRASVGMNEVPELLRLRLLSVRGYAEGLMTRPPALRTPPQATQVPRCS
jgi:hypothetical protein